MKVIIIIATLLYCNPSFMMCTNQVCHLARLPTDVQNIIAQYLSLRNIESEANFIYRTEIKSYNVSDYHRDAQQYRRPHDCFSTYSPDNLKKAYLIHTDQNKSKVVTSDTVPEKESERAELNNVASLIDEDKEYYQTIDVAISSDGQWFGRLAQHKVINVSSGEAFENCNRAQITVIHIPSNTKRDFAIPTLLKSVTFLDFNKQGTKIITHGITYEKEERIYFMWNVVTEKEHKDKSKKTLADYLKQKGACKDLRNSFR